MHNEYILYLSNFSGKILESVPQEKRLQAIRQIEFVEQLYNNVSDGQCPGLSKLLIRLENYKMEQDPPEDRPPSRNQNYGDCFEEYIGSLPIPCREKALKKLSVVVSYFTGSCIADLLECIL